MCQLSDDERLDSRDLGKQGGLNTGPVVIDLNADLGAGVTEAFADRAYTAAGTLVSRREPGAVRHDEEEVVARSVRMAGERLVVAITGELVPVDARSLCVHGDTPSAARLARRVRAALSEAGVTVEPFA